MGKRISVLCIHTLPLHCVLSLWKESLNSDCHKFHPLNLTELTEHKKIVAVLTITMFLWLLEEFKNEKVQAVIQNKYSIKSKQLRQIDLRKKGVCSSCAQMTFLDKNFHCAFCLYDKQKYHTVGAVSKSNSKFVETDKIYTSNTYIDDRSLSGLVHSLQ